MSIGHFHGASDQLKFDISLALYFKNASTAFRAQELVLLVANVCLIIFAKVKNTNCHFYLHERRSSTRLQHNDILIDSSVSM